MSNVTCLLRPIRLFVAIKFVALYNRFASLGTYLVGDFSKLQAVANTVAKFLPVGKGNAIDYEMVVNVIGIEMGGNNHLVFCTPHHTSGFYADLMRFFGCNLSLGKALVSVVGDILSALTETALDGDHFVIGIVLGAVDARNKCRVVGFRVILYIANRRI